MARGRDDVVPASFLSLIDWIAERVGNRKREYRTTFEQTYVPRLPVTAAEGHNILMCTHP
jgi:hypothetical protein